jgi:hypothetical protein
MGAKSSYGRPRARPPIDAAQFGADPRGSARTLAVQRGCMPRMTMRGIPRLRDTPNNPHKVPPREKTANSQPSQEAGSSPGETSSSSSGFGAGCEGRLSGSEGSATGCLRWGAAAGAGGLSMGRSRGPVCRWARSGWATAFSDAACAGIAPAARTPHAATVAASIRMEPDRGPPGKLAIVPPFANVDAVTGYKQSLGRRFGGIRAQFRRSVRICFFESGF